MIIHIIIRILPIDYHQIDFIDCMLSLNDGGGGGGGFSLEVSIIRLVLSQETDEMSYLKHLSLCLNIFPSISLIIGLVKIMQLLSLQTF
jgi:hypothetical protein